LPFTTSSAIKISDDAATARGNDRTYIPAAAWHRCVNISSQPEKSIISSVLETISFGHSKICIRVICSHDLSFSPWNPLPTSNSRLHAIGNASGGGTVTQG
jgi:hypothetical protein